MRFTKFLRVTASAAVLSAVAAGVAYAQDEVTSVDEIVVTAQKREQNLQDVPIVVTALPEAALENAGVKDIKDMTILTPGLTVTSTSNESSTTARIRGVGTVGDNPGLESSVGVVIDGVYRPRNGVGFGDLGEMQRIEILKGPQGTLFGKNTSAGVINIITKAPSFDYGVELEGTAGDYGQLGMSASVTGAIVDDVLAGRLYVARRQRDGFYDVDTGDGPRTNTQDNDQDFWTGRAQLLFQPSDIFDLRFIADYTHREEVCCAAVQIRTGPTSNFINALAVGTGVSIPADPYARVAFANRDNNQDIRDRGWSAEANLDFESINATLTSVTAMRAWDLVNGLDLDFSGADIAWRDDNGDNGVSIDTFSQEFRLAGATEHLDWLIGAFYSTEDLMRRDSYIYGSDYNAYTSFLLTAANVQRPDRLGCFTAVVFNPACLANGLNQGVVNTAGDGIADIYSQNSESLAFFTNNSWRFAEGWELTVGLRYTMDSKAVVSKFNNTGSNGAVCAAALANATPASAKGLLCLPWANPFFETNFAGFGAGISRQSFDDDDLSGTAKLSYRMNENIMLYGSYARGYKAGGFNLDRIQSSNGLQSGGSGVVPVANTFFPAETVDSYELGAKTTWANGSFLFNATYFHQEFTDFQLNAFLGTSFTVQSIPGLTAQGVDADMIWFTPLEGLSFTGGVTYTDAEYDNFTAADLDTPSTFGPLSLLPGNRPSFAPEWSISGSATFDRDIGDNLRLLLNFSGKYMTDYNTKSDLLPLGEQDAFFVANARIGIGAPDRSWTVEFWANNVFDEEYKQVAFNASLQGTFFQSTVQPNGTYYNPALDTGTYDAFLGAPRTMGVTLKLKY
ncbi:MAG: TonB-dependent receptor [Caulobacteraceae bacterium]|nr:TonB-dependent receptor [Caulobacteraceae bacterium]